MINETPTDKMVREALVGRHGTIILNDPSRALLVVGEENSQLHEEMDRCHRELDIYRDALTIIAYLTPGLTGGVQEALTKAQTLAKAALSQIMRPIDRHLLNVVQRQNRRDDDARQQ